MKILIIDDQHSIRVLIRKRVLEVLDVLIEEASGVEEAIRQLQNKKYDLVICDYWMDDGHGDHVAEYIATSVPESPPFIIFSSDQDIVSQYLHERKHSAFLKSDFNGLISEIIKQVSTKD